jgi:hypothetical protein
MILDWIVTAALAVGASLPVAPIQRYADGGWELAIRHSPFSEQTRCLLGARNGRIHYQPGALGFAMGTKRAVANAWYRVDDASAVWWRDRWPDLVAADVQFDRGGLDNPTAGIVWIPLGEVVSAKRVTLSCSDFSRPRVFVLGGFAPMLAAAKRLGCTSDADFLR